VNGPITKIATPRMDEIMRPVLLACLVALSGCTTFKPPQITYDADIPPVPNPPSLAEDRPPPIPCGGGASPGENGVAATLGAGH
jgi:hypothetical protein